MANKPQAVAAAQSAIPGVNAAPAADVVVLSQSELETIEQLGREYWIHTETLERTNRSMSQCDTALFDLVRGVDYRYFMAIRAAYITGCRDKGAPSDDAAAKVWERAINRLGNSFEFTRPKAESEAAKKMAAKREALAAMYASKSDGELLDEKNKWMAMGDPTSLKKAAEIAKEEQRRAKPVLDAEETARKAVLDKLLTRAKELAKARTADADEKLTRALLAMS